MGSLTASIGDLVPTVKQEPGESCAAEPTTSAAPPPVEEKLDKDVLCPICMQIIKDAFLTACGHNFCYMCILTHLQNKSTCPSCSHFLTPNLLYPNFLLNKLLMKASARQIARTAPPLEQLRQALEQGCVTSVKELESLMNLIAQKKSKMEQEQAETNLQILLDFLHCLRKKRLDELNEIKCDLQFIKEDIQAVEMQRIEFYRRRDKYSDNLGVPSDEASLRSLYPFSNDKSATSLRTPTAPAISHHLRSSGSQNQKRDVKLSESPSPLTRGPQCFSEMENITQCQQVLARKRRVQMQFGELQECYLQKRRHWARSSQESRDRDMHASNREGFSQGLQDFQSVLSSFTRYSRLNVVAELRHGDLFHSANIVSSIEFDRDDELFATAGVSRRIKIFDFASVVNEPAEAQYPVADIVTRSKLSCLSWNKSIKNQIASSDYEGIVTVWDAATRQSVMEYEEHEKRAWSVDFSRTEPSMLVSGSDDCKVKVWCTRQEASAINIDMKANICSVKYNPGSSFHIAIGSADHHIHYYDLRKTSQPLHIFSGHRKAVSYVKFLSNNQLASASTDSTLRLWDVRENIPLRVFRGHTNEKNFVGLTVDTDYIACGSETNEVFIYHKDISKPAAWHRFVNSDVHDGEDDMGSYFISAVSWKSGSSTMLAANSQGRIKVLMLSP